MIDLKALPRFLELPVLSLQTAVVFPHASRSIVLNRPSLLRSHRCGQRRRCHRGRRAEEPGAGRAEHLRPLPDRHARDCPATRFDSRARGAIPIALDGIGRIRLDRELQHAPYLRAKVERIDSIVPADDDVSFGLLRTRLVELVAELVTHSLTLPDDLVAFARQLGDPGALADVVAAGVVEVAAERHELLAELDVRRRIEKLIEIVRPRADCPEASRRAPHRGRGADRRAPARATSARADERDPQGARRGRRGSRGRRRAARDLAYCRPAAGGLGRSRARARSTRPHVPRLARVQPVAHVCRDAREPCRGRS